MTYWELLYIAYSCLGDFTAIGLPVRPVPEPLRPLAASVRAGDGAPLCRAIPQIERHGQRSIAEQRVKALGRGSSARLRWCQKFRCWDKTILWNDRLVVDGREIE